MSFFESAPVPCREEKLPFVFENEYIRWTHSPESGQLTGAEVKNGTGKNLLAAPLHSAIVRMEEGTPVTYTAGACAESVETSENSVRTVCRFFNADGRPMPGFRVEHTTEYGAFGEARHTMRFVPETALRHIATFQPVIFAVPDTFNQLGVRERHINGPGYWSQHPVHWLKLHGGTCYQDFLPRLSCHLPLSMLFLHSGADGLQIELGDDLDAWEPHPGYQESAVIYDGVTHCYNVRYASFLTRQDESFTEPFTLQFRMTLPFVRRNIVPLRRAACGILYHRNFQNRWPSDEDLQSLANAGFDLLRVHCDADTFKNGIFWRGATYPPFPPEEMAKMDDFLVRAHKYGIHAVPYFSVKEMHPDADAYKAHALEWARLSAGDSQMKVSKFGSVMCLESGWEAFRKEMIRLPLANHDFDGIYYDWCTGLECRNKAHCGKTHWDNDKLLEHLKWTCETFGKQQKERYLHLTFCPSLAAENIATQVITEETGFPSITPEIFSPHVHFLNIAPRQICDMLPKNADDCKRLKLAMCALLHHATVSGTSPVFTDFYAGLSWLDTVTKYRRHSAPGEEIISSHTPETGFSAYWHDSEMLIVGANLSETEKIAEYTLKLPGGEAVKGTMPLPPLAVETQIITR